jgi:Fe2+ or Zn2+ uptake regulation protein
MVAFSHCVIDRHDPSLRTELEARIRREVLEYLCEHPHAMDNLEGIATWWLPRHEVRVGVEQVARALESLETDGFVERIGDAERPLFRLRSGHVSGDGVASDPAGGE